MTHKTKPFEHQLKAFEKFKDEEFFALFMDMGLGKSKVAIDIAVHKYQTNQINSVLVIAPNSVHEQWASEQIPTHCAIDYSIFTWYASKRHRSITKRSWENFMLTQDKLRFFMVNVETFSSKASDRFIAEYVKNTRVFTIVDEATKIKTPSSARTKSIMRLNKYGQRAILTGTPVTKTPFDLYAMFNFLKNDFFGINFFIFKHRYGVLIKGIEPNTGRRYTKLIDEKDFNRVKSKINKVKPQNEDDYDSIAVTSGISVKDVKFIETQSNLTRFKRLDELKQAIDHCTFYAKKSDCLDLPEKIYAAEYIKMSDEQSKIYHDVRKNLRATYLGKELTVLVKVAVFTRLSQIAGGYFPYISSSDESLKEKYENVPHYLRSLPLLIGKSNPKIVRIKEILEETEGQSIIIWASFVAEIKDIYESLKKDYNCAMYYGKTSSEERKRIKNDFVEGSIQILIGNPSTAGYGLNLQVSTLQIWFSNSYKTEVRLQGEDRSHRIGQTQNVVYKDLICKGTVDEKIYNSITEGRNLNDFFSSMTLEDLLE